MALVLQGQALLLQVQALVLQAQALVLAGAAEGLLGLGGHSNGHDHGHHDQCHHDHLEQEQELQVLSELLVVGHGNPTRQNGGHNGL